MQDSFLTIFNKMNQYKHKGSFEGWLKRITIRTAIQKYRKKAPLQIVKEITDNIEEVSINLENTSIDLDVFIKLYSTITRQISIGF